MGAVFKTGRGVCPKCANGIEVNYRLQDMTGDNRIRVDRMWDCAERHRETRVEER